MIIPAIDLMKGKAVQLRQGRKKILEESNLNKLIRKFSIFPETNIIDLDAALSKGSNRALVKKLCKNLCCNVGGGIRDKETAYEYLRAGARHIIIGTSATPDFLKQLPAHRVIVALDMKNGKVAVEGWTKTIRGKLKDKIKFLEKYCSGFLITNVDIEGLNKGASIEFIRNLQNLTSKRVIVAGGIASYDEITQIDRMGFDQVIGMAVYTGKIHLEEALLSILDFSKGLIPTISQDEEGNVLILAYSNKEAVAETLKTRKVHYYSRSRKQLWMKGETSDNTQKLLQVRYDCDADAIVYTVKQTGVACHMEKYSCFSDKEFSLNYLLSFLKKRIEQDQQKSYTCKLAKNAEKLNKKIIEEAFEVTQAKTRDERVWEVADLLYFTLVYMAKHRLRMSNIVNELSCRHSS